MGQNLGLEEHDNHWANNLSGMQAPVGDWLDRLLATSPG